MEPGPGAARAIGGYTVYVYTEIHRRGFLAVNHFTYL
tara:strand:- start:849 stop:959 length:111 start_codon:yes stop_codon:yes gene_type:complete